MNAESATGHGSEYRGLAPEDVAAAANQMLEAAELRVERALAIAIALRDRIEAQDELERDPTSAILAGMVVEELGPSSMRKIQQCVTTLLNRGEAVSQA